MAWRVARSLDILLGQLNRAYPGRSIASDGSIGDAAHATRASDHNPWYVLDGWGIVTARDFTHDPAHGFDAHALAERLRLSRDRRIKYVISNGRIFAGNAGPSPWQWRAYSGSNPHTKHVHLSVVASRLCDDTTPWSAVTAVLGSRIPTVQAPTAEKDWFDMATQQDLIDAVTHVLRTEGVSGAADPRLYRPVVDASVTTGTAHSLRTEGISEGVAECRRMLGLLVARAPETITAADIAAAIPQDLAAQVADELARRLQGA